MENRGRYRHRLRRPRRRADLCQQGAKEGRLRRWLLACVGILLVADGYWASQNLVLKSADDGIYWFRFPPLGGQIYIPHPSEGEVDENDKQPRLSRQNGKWMANGLVVSDIKNFMRYDGGPDDPDGDCALGYELSKNVTIASVIVILKLSFAAGAEDAAIYSPVVEVVGRPDERRTALFFNTPKVTNATCPFTEEWKKSLRKGEHGFGYPPNVKAAKKAN